jgi:hypothetical protein
MALFVTPPGLLLAVRHAGLVTSSLAIAASLLLATPSADARPQAAASQPTMRFATYPVDLRVTPTLNGARLRLGILHPRTRAILRKFDIVHGRQVDLFVISQDLEFFSHEQPVQQPDGIFMVDVALPRAGPYMAIAEFLPDGGTPQLSQQAFTTGEPFARDIKPAPDTTARIVDGMRVSVDATKLSAGQLSPLTFRIDDAASGAPITDLEPALDAAAHVLMVSADLTEAVRAHSDTGSGPEATVTLLVPKAGRYKAWLQVQRHGRVSTAAFVLDVP